MIKKSGKKYLSTGEFSELSGIPVTTIQSRIYRQLDLAEVQKSKGPMLDFGVHLMVDSDNREKWMIDVSKLPRWKNERQKKEDKMTRYKKLFR